MPQPVKIRAIIKEIIDHAPGLRTFIFSPERQVPVFRPGQFLHLAIDKYDPSQHWPESRVFSIASSPNQRDLLRITVSAVGRFTRRMMELKTHDEVWIKLPYGDFVIETCRDRPTVLIAGGTGITPFISWICSSTCDGAGVVVLYGAKTSEFLIYKDALKQAALRYPAFRWIPFIEQGSLAGSISGRLSAEHALTEASRFGDPTQAIYYLSGPPAMLSSLKDGLLSSGVVTESIRIDAWD